MSLTNTLNVARSALTAHSYGVRVASDNIANVHTPGYARRTAELSARIYGADSEVGGGVSVSTQERVVDTFLNNRYLSTSSHSGAGAERHQLLQSVEGAFDVTDAGSLGAALDSVFGSFSALSINPNNPSARAQVLSDMESFATKVNDVANTVATQRTSLASRAGELSKEVNELTTEIASLNQQITLGTGAGGNTAALEDRRFQAMESLSQLVDFQAIPDGDGRISIQTGGAVLVMGDEANSLVTTVNPAGDLQYLVQTGSGSSRDITQSLNGGSLAAVRDVRDVDLVQIGADLDQFAYDVGTALNTQHQAGFDATGAAGGSLFDVGATVQGAARALTVHSDVAGLPDNIAAAGAPGPAAGDGANALALAGLRTANIAAGGSRTGNEEYARIISGVGRTVANARSSSERMTAIRDQAFSMRDALSGVSLEEEMVNLTKHQRAYEAATRVVQVVDELFQDLLARV